MPDDRQMDGIRVLITGGSSGIGAATARRFAAGGARVAICARRPGPLDRLVDELGSGATAIRADVADPNSAAEAVHDAAATLGGLDVLVNSAGVAWPAGLAEIDAAHWNQVIATNLSGTFFVSQVAGLLMRENGGGTIVNVGSELSTLGASNWVAYCASKAGVIGLTKALAVELAPAVTVNAVCPGPVETPMLTAEFEASGDPAAARRENLDRLPLDRIASPEEVARAITFLAVDAPFATGTALALDGGSTAAC